MKLNIANLKGLTVHTMVLTPTFQIPSFISVVEAYYIAAIVKAKAIPEFLNSLRMKVIRLTALGTGHLYTPPQKKFLVLIAVRV